MKYKINLKGKIYEVIVERGEAEVVAEYEAVAQPVAVAPITSAAPVAQAAPSAGTVAGTAVTAPLPGNVLSINVSVGQAVKAGDVVCIIEAMKMENEVTAQCDGTVKQLVAAKGTVVATGDTLMII